MGGTERPLKSDLFGRVDRVHLSGSDGPITAVRRDVGPARWWARGLARHLARREQRALQRLAAAGVPRVPRPLRRDGDAWLRSWLDGAPMQQARPADAAYFAAALRLLVRLHRAGVTHNDLAKEPNWLVGPDGGPALIDFQLAAVHRRRGRRFRLQAREDLRHLLKHKRTYLPERLTPRERAILASPSWPARLWRRTGKRLYLFVTRRLLGWADREGAGDRGAA